MARSNAVTVPEFREKIDVVKALLKLKTDAQFADLMGLTSERLSTYINKDGVKGRMPLLVVERMAERLSRKLATMTEEEAKAAWLASFNHFFLALALGMRSAFTTLIGANSPALKLDVLLLTEGLGAVDDDFPAVPGEAIPPEARFQIVVAGAAPDAFLVALVQSLQGWHFVAPRSAEPLVFGPSGVLRAPPGRLRFLKDGGWHSIYAFSIARKRVPFLLGRSEFRSPLSSQELDQFAIELGEDECQFTFGLREVYVTPAPAAQTS